MLLGIWRRPLHVSWLLTWFSAALMAGIILAATFRKPLFAGTQPAIAGGLLLAVVVMKRSPTVALVFIAIAAGLVLGLWRGENRLAETSNYRVFIGQTVQLHGTIADDITVKSGQAGLRLRDVRIGQTRLGGQVWASSSTGLSLKRGDQIELSGELRPGFGSYAASMSFAKLTSAIRPPGGDPSRSVRDAFDTGLERTVPQQEAALGIGYLTGQHNLVPDILIKQLQLVGLIHLVIAGGYNVTILVRLIRRLCLRISKRLAMLAAGGMLFGLTLVAGFVAPMARTAIVTSLSLATWYYGRWPHPVVLLSVAAATTAFIDPAFVWGDVGWYMTFVAYGGLIVLGPMLKRWFWGEEHHGEIKQIIVDTLAVQIVTTPLMAFAFQQYSIYGLPANLLVLPFMPLTMLAATVAGAAGMFLPAAATHWAGWPASVLLSYTSKVTVWMAGAPGAGAVARLDARGMVLAYAAILLFIWRLKRKIGYDFRTGSLVGEEYH
ncbi:MAG TPA: ComEC/Rec2 family competence protein [Candidatus Saccharimonadales bacterium]|nr:ComEC/Rec2 family competence protein [Candidatus Saccharimonadales bacterium]